MIEQIIVVILCVVVPVISDYKLLKQSSLRDRLVYGAITTLFLYLSIIYVGDLDWPQFQELLDLTVSGPSEPIVEWLKRK
ncbi:hypothetical protein [Paenibacillus sp. YYML68]|uniref:hypothetical protein n=1 Tax=Paenibacillus sp. YYML68 TaxID=2909250 RepID=UPI00248F6A9E|nr:hypothetical protein [Paenibacillus sp. YYML68]